MASTVKKNLNRKVRIDHEHIALVLQGGGALGAYQAGVYEEIATIPTEPHWIAGVSIGAINAALIAGNPPARRVERYLEHVGVDRLRLDRAAFGVNGLAQFEELPPARDRRADDIAGHEAEPAGAERKIRRLSRDPQVLQPDLGAA